MKIFLYIFLIIILTGIITPAQDEKSCTSAGCHQELIAHKFIHPAAEDDCTNCHEGKTVKHPSKSGNDFSLVDESPALCYSCHDDKEPDKSMKSIHPPFEEDCLNCHNPHSSDNKFVLEDPVPELCLNCHDDPAKIKNVKTVHGAMYIKNKCVNCHSPHSSVNRKLLKKEDPALCLNCHNKKIKYKDKVIPNIAKKIADEDLAHPPVVDDGCLTCHHPHSSVNNFLLDDTFPSGHYAKGFDDNYNLCFSCHDDTKILDKKTTDATEFRNGNTNLHFVHVNKEKSRSCINCHDVHGSPNEHLIATKVKFGSWEMKINYKSNEDGGSCSPGCHGKKSYKR